MNLTNIKIYRAYLFNEFTLNVINDVVLCIRDKKLVLHLVSQCSVVLLILIQIFS
jgi:hypothetical protein